MKLIINGDDFGITHACNLAIIDCFQNGSLSSTSMMTNMPWAAEAAKLWEENPELSVGIHLSLTAGKPLTNVPSLVKEDGTFNKAILKDPDLADPKEMEQELEAQIAKFVELTGKLPDHINSHHGIEMIPQGERLLEKLSRKYDLPIRAFLNKPRDHTYNVEYVVPYWPMPENFFTRDQNAPLALEEALSGITPEMLQSDEYFELAGHPGYVDKDLIEISSLQQGRAYDAANFSSQALRDWMKENQVELISYKDLPKQSHKEQAEKAG